MGIKYAFDEAWTIRTKEIANKLGYTYIIPEKVSVVRSWGSKTKRTIARIHAMGKVMMLGTGNKKSFYIIELITEKFDRQSEDDKIETIIHELMHIPRTFGGGFRQHDHVCSANVKQEFRRYMNLRAEPSQTKIFWASD